MTAAPRKTIKRIILAAAEDYGHSVRIDMEAEDGSLIPLYFPLQIVSRLLEAAAQAAALAERMQKAQPGQALSIETPHLVTGVRAGRTHDNRLIAMQFQTSEGFPVRVAMPREIAQETIERVAKEIRNLDKPPQKHS